MEEQPTPAKADAKVKRIRRIATQKAITIDSNNPKDNTIEELLEQCKMLKLERVQTDPTPEAPKIEKEAKIRKPRQTKPIAPFKEPATAEPVEMKVSEPIPIPPAKAIEKKSRPLNGWQIYCQSIKKVPKKDSDEYKEYHNRKALAK